MTTPIFSDIRIPLAASSMRGKNRYLSHLLTLFLLCAGALSPAQAAATAKQWPQHVMVAPGMEVSEAQRLLQTAETYYAFWDSGDEALLYQALSQDFIDLNLPDGRPQGIEGPVMASKNFRKAVPDLAMEVEQIYILPDTVIGRLHFTGHFTGVFAERKGNGQAIDFKAVDMYTIKDGKITHNWHLEDNLTLLKQLGMVVID